MARPQIRVSRELMEIIDSIKAKHLLAGKTPPTIKVITRAIAKRIKKEELLRDEFIRF